MNDFSKSSVRRYRLIKIEWKRFIRPIRMTKLKCIFHIVWASIVIAYGVLNGNNFDWFIKMKQIRNGFNCEWCQWLKQLTNSQNQLIPKLMIFNKCFTTQNTSYLRLFRRFFEVFEFVVWEINFRQVLWLSQTDEQSQYVAAFELKGYWLVYGRIGPFTFNSNMKARKKAEFYKCWKGEKERRKLIKSLIYAYLWWTECEVALISFSM